MNKNRVEGVLVRNQGWYYNGAKEFGSIGSECGIGGACIHLLTNVNFIMSIFDFIVSAICRILICK